MRNLGDITLTDVFIDHVRAILSNPALGPREKVEGVLAAAKELRTSIDMPRRPPRRPTLEEKAAEKAADPFLQPYLDQLRKRRKVGEKEAAATEALRASSDPTARYLLNLAEHGATG